LSILLRLRVGPKLARVTHLGAAYREHVLEGRPVAHAVTDLRKALGADPAFEAAARQRLAEIEALKAAD
jgi:hypothetical protein